MACLPPPPPWLLLAAAPLPQMSNDVFTCCGCPLLQLPLPVTNPMGGIVDRADEEKAADEEEAKLMYMLLYVFAVM